MARPRHDASTRLGPDDREALITLAPLRLSLERIVTQRHAGLTPGGAPNPRLVDAEVELIWTLVLHAFRLGLGAVYAGLHRAEGIDHKLIDEALDFAMAADLQDRKGKKK